MQKSSQQNLITPAFVLSIIGGVLSVFFIALSIFGVVVLYQQKDTFIDKLTDELLKDNPSSDYDSAHAVATITWNVLIVFSIIGSIYSVYSCTVNWIGLSFIQRTRITGKYSLAPSILQVIAFPFGTVAGILMLVARSKNFKKIKK